MSIDSYRWMFVFAGIMSLLVLLSILAMKLKYIMNRRSTGVTVNVHPTPPATITNYQHNVVINDLINRQYYLPSYNEALTSKRMFMGMNPPSYTTENVYPTTMYTMGGVNHLPPNNTVFNTVDNVNSLPPYSNSFFANENVNRTTMVSQQPTVDSVNRYS